MVSLVFVKSSTHFCAKLPVFCQALSLHLCLRLFVSHVQDKVFLFVELCEVPVCLFL